MFKPDTHADLIGKKATLLPDALNQEWTDLGVDAATVFRITSIVNSGVSFSSVRIIIADEDGEEYVAPAGSLLLLPST